MKHNRSMLIAIAWLLAAVCLLCCAVEALPAHEPDHTCSGEGCLVCLCISLREVLSAMAILLSGLVFAVCFEPICAHFGRTMISPRRWTPVCLKVKLSN